MVVIRKRDSQGQHFAVKWWNLYVERNAVNLSFIKNRRIVLRVNRIFFFFKFKNCVFIACTAHTPQQQKHLDVNVGNLRPLVE